MTSQADRERFAPMLGFRSLDGRSRYYDSLGRREINSSSHLPDFLDPKGEYFGPAAITLASKGWSFRVSDQQGVRGFEWRHWTFGYPNAVEAQFDPNPVRATMLALEKEAAGDGGRKMRPTLRERFRRWVCSKVGHKQGETWYYGTLHATCKRCGVIYDP